MYFLILGILGCSSKTWSVDIPYGDKTLTIEEIEKNSIDYVSQSYYLIQRKGSTSQRIGKLSNFFPVHFEKFSKPTYFNFLDVPPIKDQATFYIDPNEVTEKEFREIGQAIARNLNKISNLRVKAAKGMIYGNESYFRGDDAKSPIHFVYPGFGGNRYIIANPDEESKVSLSVVTASSGSRSESYLGSIIFNTGSSPKLDIDLRNNPQFKNIGEILEKCFNSQGKNIFDYY